MVVRRRPMSLAALALLVLLPFQNCSSDLTAAKSQAASQQCKAQLKADAIAARGSGVFHCSEFNSYQCERRIFSPTLENMVHNLTECLGGGDICVDVEVRQINTSAARKYEPEESFAAGAEYNREEFRCHHRYIFKGLAVFEGQGESMEEALAMAMRSCEEAMEAQ